MATTTTIIVKSFPTVSADTLNAQYIVHTSGTVGKGSKQRTVDETETVDVSIALDERGRPVSKTDHVSAGKLYMAMRAHLASVESEYMADYRTAMAEWRKVVDAIASGQRSGNVPAKPIKPEYDSETAETVRQFREWLNLMRKQWAECRKYLIRSGKWAGPLSAVCQAKPSPTSFVVNAK